MGIVDDDIERVRSATDLVALLGEHVALRKVGSRFVGLCPFHTERSGSFSVNAELGVYYCFGCQAKGDAISFLRETQHLDFVGAVEQLAARAGITLRYDDERQSGQRGRRATLVEAMTKAVDWYHARLLASPDAASARGYLRSRGYDGDIVRRFSLGWAPEGWDQLARSLGGPPDVLRDTGLAFTNKAGRLQDSFRGRIIFPIFDARGDPVAFGGRILPGAEGPKYKNSTGTAIYDKSEVLYGLHWAKADMVRTGEVVVCEGYTDVIGLHQAGISRAVATCGTALTDRHLAVLRGFTRRIVLAYDADAAGQGAAERVYAWERTHDVDVLVAALPAGSDPGELAQRQPEAMVAAIEGARPFLAFRLDRLFAGADLRTAESRARAADTAMAMVAEHPNAMVRDEYVMVVADRCRVDPERLRQLPAPSARPSSTAGGRPAADGSNPAGAGPARRRPDSWEDASPTRPRRRSGLADSPALMVLRVAVHRPEDVAGMVAPCLFADEVERAAFEALARADTLHEAIAESGPEVAELLGRLAVEEPDVEAEDVVARLVSQSTKAVIRSLQTRAHATGEVSAASDLGWLKVRVMLLDEVETRGAAITELVPFLVARADSDAAIDAPSTEAAEALR